MKCVALTAIAAPVIAELKHCIPRTIELRSAHNVISLSSVTPGSEIFMTTITCEDLAKGDKGIIVEVLSVNISMNHVIEVSHGHHIMEKERMSARLKVRFISNSTVKTSSPCIITEPRIVDVVKPVSFHAG